MSDAIEAARIAAHAAIWAAWIQGGLTLIAGTIAIGGGSLAYRGAITAARIQVEHEKKIYNALAAAYRTRMTQISLDIADHVFVDQVHVEQNAGVIRMEPFTIPGELTPTNWRDHAMLSDEGIVAVRALYNAAKNYREFFDQMHGKPADANSEIFGDEHAIDAYRHLNQSLGDRAKELRSSLGGDSKVASECTQQHGSRNKKP